MPIGDREGTEQLSLCTRKLKKEFGEHSLGTSLLRTPGRSNYSLVTDKRESRFIILEKEIGLVFEMEHSSLENPTELFKKFKEI